MGEDLQISPLGGKHVETSFPPSELSEPSHKDICTDRLVVSDNLHTNVTQKCKCQRPQQNWPARATENCTDICCRLIVTIWIVDLVVTCFDNTRSIRNCMCARATPPHTPQHHTPLRPTHTHSPHTPYPLRTRQPLFRQTAFLQNISADKQNSTPRSAQIKLLPGNITNCLQIKL